MIDTSEQSVKMCYIACSDKKRNDGHCECHNNHKQQFCEIERSDLTSVKANASQTIAILESTDTGPLDEVVEWKPGTIANDFVPVMPMDAPDPNVTLLTFIDYKTTKWFAWRPVKLNSGKCAWLKWVHRHEDIRPVTYQGLVPIVTYSEIPIIYDTDNHSSALH